MYKNWFALTTLCGCQPEKILLYKEYFRTVTILSEKGMWHIWNMKQAC